MSTTQIQERVTGYNSVFEEQDYSRRVQKAQNVTDNFYTLITEIYERGWGQSFHFAPRYKGEDFHESIVRHEHFLAMKLGLSPDDNVLDVGCGVMGPARNIARLSGAHITGLTINQHQVERCKALNGKSGVSQLLDVKQGDFMNIPFADNSFDKMYAIEALCHAPDVVKVYQQIYSKLKPGGMACFYEWAMTDKFDPSNPEHVRLKKDIEYGNSICELNTTARIEEAILESGFKKIETIDLALDKVKNDVPWYATLESGFSLSQLRHTKICRNAMQLMLRGMEKIGVVPKGTSAAHKILIIAAESLTKGGQLGIFTPMYMVLVRK